MLQIIVASANPVKIKAAQLGFTQMFPQTKFEIGVILALIPFKNQKLWQNYN